VSTRSPCLTLVTLAEDKADRLEACRALLPPEVELDAQQGAVVAAVAEPVAQQEVVAAAVAEPGALQAVAMMAARSGVRQQEPSVD
jgi:hypothetical protein